MSTMVESCWETEYWLRHCEGFRVLTQDGETGYVDSVELTPNGDAAALVVRFGELFTHDVVLPVDAIDELDPVAETMTIAPLTASGNEIYRQLRIPAV